MKYLLFITTRGDPLLARVLGYGLAGILEKNDPVGAIARAWQPSPYGGH